MDIKLTSVSVELYAKDGKPYMKVVLTSEDGEDIIVADTLCDMRILRVRFESEVSHGARN